MYEVTNNGCVSAKNGLAKEIRAPVRLSFLLPMPHSCHTRMFGNSPSVLCCCPAEAGGGGRGKIPRPARGKEP